MSGDRQAPARNMSAPPSTTLTFAALAPESGATGDAVADGTGLAFVCRLDACALLPKTCRSATATRHSRDPKLIQDRIRVALVYARAEATGRRRAPPKEIAKTYAGPFEALADELRDLLAAQSLADAGLPAVGLFLPAQADERAVLGDFRRTLAILARRRGTLFLRDADPIVWTAVDGEPLDLWTPTPARKAIT